VVVKWVEKPLEEGRDCPPDWPTTVDESLDANDPVERKT